MLDGATPSAEDVVLRAEALQHLDAALHALPFHHRIAVVLHDEEGHSYRTVGAVLQAQEGKVRAWAYRGRVQLRDLLS
jgi:DNA-directed RNA polymerase specialized sigma24 family protein